MKTPSKKNLIQGQGQDQDPDHDHDHPKGLVVPIKVLQVERRQAAVGLLQAVPTKAAVSLLQVKWTKVAARVAVGNLNLDPSQSKDHRHRHMLVNLVHQRRAVETA